MRSLKEGKRVNIYTAVSLLLFCVLLIMKLPEYQHTNTVYYYYCLDYSMGFNARMFMGTVFNFLFRGNITGERLFAATLVVTVAICIMTSRLIGMAWVKLEKQSNCFVCLLILVLLYPFSVNFFFSGDCCGRLEVYCLFFALLSVFLIEKSVFRWLIPFLCFAAVATYEGFVFTFMPIIAIALLYNVISNGYKPSDIVLCFVSYTVIIASFVYFQFGCDNLVYDTVYEMIEAAALKYDGEFDRNATDALMMQYYVDSSTYWKEAIRPILKDLIGSYLPVLLLIISPVAVSLATVWKSCFNVAARKIDKFFFIVCACLPAAAIPSYILATDWGRWTACWVSTQLLSLLIFAAKGDKTVVYAFDRISDILRKYPFVTAVVIMFCTSLYLSSVPDAIIQSVSDDAVKNLRHWFDVRY